jgi:hypothetical protein
MFASSTLLLSVLALEAFVSADLEIITLILGLVVINIWPSARITFLEGHFFSPPTGAALRVGAHVVISLSH